MGEQGPLGVCGRGMGGTGRGAEYKALRCTFPSSQGVWTAWTGPEHWWPCWLRKVAFLSMCQDIWVTSGLEWWRRRGLMEKRTYLWPKPTSAALYRSCCRCLGVPNYEMRELSDLFYTFCVVWRCLEGDCRCSAVIPVILVPYTLFCEAPLTSFESSLWPDPISKSMIQPIKRVDRLIIYFIKRYITFRAVLSTETHWCTENSSCLQTSPFLPAPREHICRGGSLGDVRS